MAGINEINNSLNAITRKKVIESTNNHNLREEDKWDLGKVFDDSVSSTGELDDNQDSPEEDVLEKHSTIDNYTDKGDENPSEDTDYLADDLKHENERLKAKALTIDRLAFRGVTGELVNAITPHSEADPVNILMSILAIGGNYFGLNAYIKIEGKKRYLNYCFAIVGESGEGRKGTGLSHAINLFNEIDSDYIKNRRTSGVMTGHHLVNKLRDPSEHDAGRTDNRVLWVEEEFSFTLKQIKDGTLSEISRGFYDNYYAETGSKGDPQTATGIVSQIAHITPDELEANINEVELNNGFANRFMWFWVNQSKFLHGDKSHKIPYELLASKLHSIFDWAMTVKEITMTPDAERRFSSMRIEIRHNDSLPKNLKSLTVRAEEYIKRIACWYALMDRRNLIIPDDLESAWAIYEHSINSMASKIFGNLPINSPALTLLAWLKEAGDDGLNLTQISEKFKSKRIRSYRYNPILQELEELGKVRKEGMTIGDAKKPTTTFFWVKD